MSGILIDDMFKVKDVDPDGKKFQRVSRLFCDSENFKFVTFGFSLNLNLLFSAWN